MENAKKSTLAFLLPYALGLLVIRLVIDTIIKQFELGYNGESYGSILALIIEVGIIFVTINNYKKFQNNNSLHFGEGVKIGVGLLLIMGTLFSMYIFLIHAKLIDPTYQERLITEATQKLLENNPNANVDTLTNSKKGDDGTLTGVAFWIIKYIFIGALGGIVSSAILKTER